MISPAPIALFAYNRPAHTRRLVASLQRNALARASELVVFSDAPKAAGEVEQVGQVRRFIGQIDGFRSVTLVERERNLGLARSIIDGVTAVVGAQGRVIVLEDDLTVTPHFLEFMNRALETYADAERVIQVSGYMFPVPVAVEEDALFLPLTTSWGWATWRRAWRWFDPAAEGYARLKADPELRRRFNLGGAYDYFSLLEDQLAGRVDSWAVRWQLVAFLREALTLYPRYALTANTGFDGSGTHPAAVGLLARSNARDDFSPRRFPRAVETSPAWDAVASSLRPRRSLMDLAKRALLAGARRLTGRARTAPGRGGDAGGKR